MILGTLTHWDAYKTQLPAGMATVVESVKALDLDNMAIGRYEIPGSRSFFLIQEMPSMPADQMKAEAHRTYADVQILLKGAERYGIAPLDSTMQPDRDLLDPSDIAFYAQPRHESFVDLQESMFAVFFPGEFHRPCCAIDGCVMLRKAVIKVHPDDWERRSELRRQT